MHVPDAEVDVSAGQVGAPPDGLPEDGFGESPASPRPDGVSEGRCAPWRLVPLGRDAIKTTGLLTESRACAR